jgi:predicted deacylase
MRTETIELAGATPGCSQRVTALHYGQPGRGPKAYIQAALHADEIPALLVAQVLRARLAALEAAGEVLGHLVLVPFANPVGLAQQALGLHQGRFDLRDGVNFNRMIPDLTEAVASAVAGQLGADEVANVALVRHALRDAAAVLTANKPVTDLKRRLLQWAIDADIVLDLHCDAQAALHLYGLTPQAEPLAELGALMGARAILLATESGDSPFDEACSRPWFELQRRNPGHPVPLACFSTTVELRGEADTGHDCAQQDADAILEFLRRRGVLAGTPKPLPVPQCQPTPLAASEPITAPRSGIVVFHVQPGEYVAAGALIADLVDVDSGEQLALRSRSAGVLYARSATRWAQPGQPLAKIAGTTLARTGKLLSA